MRKNTLALMLIIIFLVCGCRGGDVFLIPDGEGGAWKTVFEDKTLTLSEQEQIFADYKEIVSFLAPQGTITEKTEFGPKCHWMRHTTKHKRTPDAGMDHIGIISEGIDGEKIAVIDCVLSDAYRKALAFREKHREAFDAFPAFVERMNALEMADLPETVGDMMYFPEKIRRESRKTEKMPIRMFVEAYGQYRFEMGSILDWVEFEGLPLANLRMFLKGDDSRFDDFPVVFEKGQWKVLAIGGMSV